MADQEENEKRLTAAECAARTGLTIRALRVYERYGLIAPARATSGWRQYGPRELIRLNTICVLKAAGLTLAQIRASLREEEPALRMILQAQVEHWKTQKEVAERGRRIAEMALQRLQGNQSPSVDQLCELIRSNEMNNPTPAIDDLLRRIQEMPAEQARPWAEQHNEEINPRWSEEFQDAVRTLVDPELERLMDAGAPAASPEVQKLIVLHLRLMAKYRIRESTIVWLTSADANNEHEQRRHEIAQRILPKLKKRPTESSDLISNQWTSNPFLVGYFADAESRSAQCLELDAMLRNVQRVLQVDVQSQSLEAQSWVERLRQICGKYDLGDPLTYSRWATLVRPPPSDISEADDKVIWGLLADSMGTPQSSQ